jgi:hypothetical protein
MLLSSALPNVPAHSDPRSGTGALKLLSTRDPLSIPITTQHFRRFVSRISPVFWLQDRVEEVVMWRKGWKVTLVWMAAYAFLCKGYLRPTPNRRLTLIIGYFPRLALLLPHVLIISVLLATYPSSSPEPQSDAKAPGVPVKEGSADWLANLQAIQNLMGA